MTKEVVGEACSLPNAFATREFPMLAVMTADPDEMVHAAMEKRALEPAVAAALFERAREMLAVTEERSNLAVLDLFTAKAHLHARQFAAALRCTRLFLAEAENNCHLFREAVQIYLSISESMSSAVKCRSRFIVLLRAAACQASAVPVAKGDGEGARELRRYGEVLARAELAYEDWQS